MRKAILATIFLAFITAFSSFGQADSMKTGANGAAQVSTTNAAVSISKVDMADALYTNGKIYVVVVVLATIFAGIFAYLVYLDRKISRIEKEK